MKKKQKELKRLEQHLKQKRLEQEKEERQLEQQLQEQKRLEEEEKQRRLDKQHERQKRLEQQEKQRRLEAEQQREKQRQVERKQEELKRLERDVQEKRKVRLAEQKRLKEQEELEQKLLDQGREELEQITADQTRALHDREMNRERLEETNQIEDRKKKCRNRVHGISLVLDETDNPLSDTDIRRMAYIEAAYRYAKGHSVRIMSREVHQLIRSPGSGFSWLNETQLTIIRRSKVYKNELDVLKSKEYSKQELAEVFDKIKFNNAASTSSSHHGGENSSRNALSPLSSVENQSKSKRVIRCNGQRVREVKERDTSHRSEGSSRNTSSSRSQALLDHSEDMISRSLYERSDQHERKVERGKSKKVPEQVSSASSSSDSDSDKENFQDRTRSTLECPQCNKVFSRRHPSEVKSDLQRHIDSVHLKLRPFKCSFCGKAFAANVYRVLHEKKTCKNRNSPSLL